ncbi:MAG: SDR family oxidoreductase [Pseudomonadota bacterium]
MCDLQQKSALVIGGSRALGAAITLGYAGRGADVVFTYGHHDDEARKTTHKAQSYGGRVEAIKHDVADNYADSAVLDTVQNRYARLDNLTYVVGEFHRASLGDTTVAEFDRIMATNTRGAFAAVQAFRPFLKPGSSITLIGSILGQIAPFAGLSLYAVSKAGLAGLGKSLARELGQDDITVNIVQPGPVVDLENPEAMDQGREFLDHIALNRLCHPDDVANLCSFLASDQARYITGQTINLDGGWTA